MLGAARGAALVTLLWAGCGTPTPPPRKVELVEAPAGDVAPAVQREVVRAAREGRRALVYVGASWCEPCRRFHDAVKAGRLDAEFGALRLLEFDLDRDGERLAAAGYAPKLIPLIALPDDHGRATGRQMEGSVKGDGALGNLVPRLHALLAPVDRL